MDHVRRHYGDKGHYACAEEGCRTVVKRWYDLVRHYRVRHCKVARRFPCNEVGCKYGGENGFMRMDKLKSHQRNKHEKSISLRRVRPNPVARDNTMSKTAWSWELGKKNSGIQVLDTRVVDPQNPQDWIK